MKRHASLAALSEDHHHELGQARRLVAAAGGAPDERRRVAGAYVDVGDESRLLDVEHLRAIDVGDGDRHQLELPVHGGVSFGRGP